MKWIINLFKRNDAIEFATYLSRNYYMEPGEKWLHSNCIDICTTEQAYKKFRKQLK